MKMNISETILTLETLRQYESALRYRKSYEAYREAFMYLVDDLLDFAKKNNVVLPHRERIYRNIEKAQSIVEEQTAPLTTKPNNQKKQPDSEQNHNYGIVRFTVVQQWLFGCGG